jgi:hypothetical protein
MRSRTQVWVVAVLVVAASGCGPAVANLVWPPPANPTMDGLYPYDFDRRGLAGVKTLHESMLGVRIEDDEREATMLYALGRAQVDAFLYGMTLEPDGRDAFMAELGEMRGVSGATEETFLSDPSILLEPFDVLALEHPKSFMASAGEDARIAFRLLTHEGLGDEEMARLDVLAGGQEAMSPFVRGVMLVVVWNALGRLERMDAGARSAAIVDELERHSGAGGESLGERLPHVLGWTSRTVRAALKDPDPLFMELRPHAEGARIMLGRMPFPVGLPAGVPLPGMVGVVAGVQDPFRYVVVDASGGMRVATSVVYVVDDKGEVVEATGKSPYAWPGRKVEDVARLGDMLAEATGAVEDLGPAGGSPL